MLSRVARLTYTRPKTVLAAVAAFVAVAIALGANVADRLVPAGFSDPDTDSAIAEQRALGRLGYDAEPGLAAVARSRGPITAPTARAEVARIARVIRDDPQVGLVRTAFAPGGGRELISKDGRSTVILAHFKTIDEAELEKVVERMQGKLHSDRLDLTVGGFAVGFNDVNETVRDDLERAELIAFPILAVLLLLVFRGLVAALIPLVIGGIAVIGTFLSLRVLSEFFDMSIFSLNITTALGLGLAVDYGLLIVSRYREELERSGPGAEAHRRTVETAGRAVLFSGLTVAAAMAALILLPQRFLYSMGAGGAIVSLLAASAALLATPSMLALLGERVNALGVRRGTVGGSSRWYRLATTVMRHPVPVAVLTALVLLAAALPIAGARLIGPGFDAIPRGTPSRDAVEIMRANFTPNLEAPIVVVLPGSQDRAERLRDRIARVDGVRAATVQPLPRGGALVQAIPRDEPLSSAAQDAVDRIRVITDPAGGVVGGQTAELIDLKASLRDHAPVALGLMAFTTMVLLFLMTGSVILPVKTVIMNALSILAAVGLVVLVFQHGVFDWFFDYDGPSALETSVGVVLAAVTFGLATDYAVLVLSRIKEFHDQGEPSDRAVALGIERTGRIITAAALLLAVVFLAFTTSGVFFMKEAGFGQAVAVAIDASIVRALLVPALMALLGQWNWWAPAPLKRMRDRIGMAEA